MCVFPGQGSVGVPSKHFQFACAPVLTLELDASETVAGGGESVNGFARLPGNSAPTRFRAQDLPCLLRLVLERRLCVASAIALLAYDYRAGFLNKKPVVDEPQRSLRMTRIYKMESFWELARFLDGTVAESTHGLIEGIYTDCRRNSPRRTPSRNAATSACVNHNSTPVLLHRKIQPLRER